VFSKLTPPVYEAAAILFVRSCPSASNSTSSADDCLNASTGAVPTYAQLLTNPVVLEPVVAQHPGLTLKQLDSMISVKPQANTQLIELDANAGNPRLAMQLANDISQSLAQFVNSQLPGTVQVLPAEQPIDPIKPRPLQYATIGALVGLGLALSLIFLFEWNDDRLANSEEVQELLNMEILMFMPKLSRFQGKKQAKEIPVLAEKYRILCANLNAVQAVKPFKLAMVTSTLAGEGKSSIAANVASFLAMTGKHVLLVDANLHHPALAQHFRLDNHPNMLLDTWAQTEVDLDGQATDIPTLRVLTVGTASTRSAEFLQSPLTSQLFEDFKKSPFDYVIFDTPALLPVADTQILAAYIQATVFVIDASKTSRKALLRVRHILDKTHTIVLGVVINKSQWSD
jgi:capsular exopolysaccharide synthesis family protein